MKLAKFPIQPNRKTPYPHILDEMNRGGFYAATTNEDQIKLWQTNLPNCNWAVATGKESGIWVLDIDVKNGAQGDKSFYKMIEGQEKWPETFTVKTPSGGLHYYFIYDERIKNLVNIGDFGGIDIKTTGGYVLCPPSVLPNGAYSVVNNCEIIKAPEWFIELLTKKEIIKHKKELEPIELETARRRAKIIYDKYISSVSKGSRNNTCMQMCCQMRDNIVPIGVAEEYVHSFVLAINESDFTYNEALKTLYSAYKYTPREPSFSLEEEIKSVKIIKKRGPVSTEQYDVAKYLAECNKNIRYVEERGWLYYLPDKGYWEAENAHAVVIKYVAEQLSDLRARFKNCKGNPFSGKNSNIKAIVELMQSLCAFSMKDFVSPPYLLNLTDNVIDLRTLKLYEHNREFNFLYRCNANYDPSADHTLAYKILHDSLKDPDEVNENGLTNMTYFLMCLGYCITGERCEECAFYIWGPPRAGKSLVVNMMYEVLGGFAGHLNMDALSSNTNDTQNFQLAGIIDKRFVVSAETDKNTRFNAAKIKTLTGGEPVTCAFKHKNLFTRTTFPKMIFSSNNEIDIDPNDDAIWSRWRVFEFPNSHTDNPDTTLKTKMWTARNGFMKLLCQAAEYWYAWHNYGYRLNYTKNMLQYLNDRRSELDIVGCFLSEFYLTVAVPSAYGYSVTQFRSTKELYGKFLSYCDDNKIPPYKEATFSSILKNKGFVRKVINGKRGYMVDYTAHTTED